MNAHTPFPNQQQGRFYITEGGLETEIMYKHGFELPHFAAFPLLNNPNAVTALRGMYRSYLDVVAKYQQCALIGGLDYRASPDWGALLGYSKIDLADANLAAIGFLRECASEYQKDIPNILIQGYVGPRGDAYQRNTSITIEEAEDYHSTQLETLKKGEVDIAMAITFNNIPEAIGVAKAAKTIGIPLGISLTLDRTSKLNSGPSLSQAITDIDEATDCAPAFYTINCSHPLEYEPAIEPGHWLQRIRGVRPNASKMEKIALCKLGHLESGDPIELGEQVAHLAKRFPHMDIWGGCCGTWSEHLEEIVKHLDE